MATDINNPIETVANAIRERVSSAVKEDFAGVFPKNVQFPTVTNLIYVSETYAGRQEGGFPNSRKLQILTPEGQFQTGWVKVDVASGWTTLRFHEAQLEPTPDLQVVRYAPWLTFELFQKALKELPEQTELERAAQVTKVLADRKNLPGFVYTSSLAALGLMGEEPPKIPFGGHASVELETMIRDQKVGELAAVLKFAKERNELIKTASGMGSVMRARPLEEWFKELVQKTLDLGIFPTVVEGAGRKWFAPDRFWNRDIAVQSRHSVPYGERYYWVISDQGELREARIEGHRGTQPIQQIDYLELRSCAEHLLTQAGYITDQFVKAAVHRSFPQLKFAQIPA